MDSTAVTITVIVVLLAANAFFVAAEFALVKVRGFRLDALADDGRFGARLTQRIAADLEAYLAACQLGITMASLGLGWVGEPAVAAVLEPLFSALELGPETVHTVSFLLGFIIFSSLHIVVGEQVPKTFAIRKPEPVSLWCAYPLRAFYLLVYPLNWLLNFASGKILGWFGVEEATHGDVLTGEEISSLVRTSEEHGVIQTRQAEMLSNLFQFDERTVARVMVPRRDVATLGADLSPEENRAILEGASYSRFPVMRSGIEVPIGIVNAKRLYRAILDSGDIPWGELEQLAYAALVVPETMRIAVLFQTMREQRNHLAIVVDEYGNFVGIATLEDLLEEIVGEIHDEFDDDVLRYTIEANDTGWDAHGLTPLADVERITGLTVPDALDANTVSGLFLHRLARMPVVGDVIVESQYELTVREVAAHHVAKVAIRQVAPTPSAGSAETDSQSEPAKSE